MHTRDEFSLQLLQRKAFFDQSAHGWEQRNYPEEIRRRLATLVPKFGLADKTTVLDVGCGEGVLVPYIREQIGNDGVIYELDPSEAMLEGAAKKDDGNVHLLLACAENIPLLSNSIDTVVAFACFPHFENKQKAVSEMFRVLKPGGLVVVAHLLNRKQLREHHAKYHAVSGDVLPDNAAMTDLFECAGFIGVSIDEADFQYLLRARKSI